MRSQIWKRFREHLSLSLKCGSVFCLFLVSVLVVACGANNTAQVPTSPPVTLTVNLNQTFGSPTPTLPPLSCGAWATESTPGYYPGANVQVYAKFVQNVDGNPQGMNQASAHAIVYWPDGTQLAINERTTSDGLAVFPVPLQASAVGHVTLIEVDFTSADGAKTCSVKDNQRAFFTALTVTPSPTPSPSATGNPFPFPPPGTGVPTFPVPGMTKTPKGG